MNTIKNIASKIYENDKDVREVAAPSAEGYKAVATALAKYEKAFVESGLTSRDVSRVIMEINALADKPVVRQVAKCW